MTSDTRATEMWSFTPASRSAQALKHECETLSGPCALLVVWFPEVHRNLNHKVQVTKSGISSNFVEVGISKFLEFLSRMPLQLTFPTRKAEEASPTASDE